MCAAVIDEIKLYRKELRALCPRSHGQRLELFGSATRGDFDPEHSDIDFLIEFARGHPDALSLETYFGLKESLEAPLCRTVDLVEPSAIRNPISKRVSNVRVSPSLKRDPKARQGSAQ
jgi:hypothetical protein